ncbi:hypothetical protein LXL04_025968 [Taraxacum kok-saghyz]
MEDFSNRFAITPSFLTCFDVIIRRSELAKAPTISRKRIDFSEVFTLLVTPPLATFLIPICLLKLVDAQAVKTMERFHCRRTCPVKMSENNHVVAPGKNMEVITVMDRRVTSYYPATCLEIRGEKCSVMHQSKKDEHGFGLIEDVPLGMVRPEPPQPPNSLLNLLTDNIQKISLIVSMMVVGGDARLAKKMAMEY